MMKDRPPKTRIHGIAPGEVCRGKPKIPAAEEGVKRKRLLAIVVKVAIPIPGKRAMEDEAIISHKDTSVSCD